MLSKTWLRILLALTVALVLAFAIVAIPTQTAHAQASNVTVAQDDADCGGYTVQVITPPVYCYWTSVTVTNFGLRPDICYDPDWNPFGYIMYYTTYSGWSYYDANGVGSYGWFQSWEGSSGWQTVTGPAIVVSTSQDYECGIPY